MALNTGARSPGERLMTCNTSAVAVSRSSAASRSARYSSSCRLSSAFAQKIGYRVVDRRGHALIRLAVVPAPPDVSLSPPAAKGSSSFDRFVGPEIRMYGVVPMER